MQKVKTHVGTRLALALAVTGGLFVATGASAQVIPLFLDAGEDEAVTAIAVGSGVGVAAAVATAGGNGLPPALQGSGVGSAPTASALLAAGTMSMMGGSGGGTTTSTTSTTLP